MPYKIWQVNEILTAADMNTYVGNQTILTFAGTAARATAIGTPVEGVFSYLQDSNQLEVYSGTANGWVSASNVLFGTAVPSDGQVVTYSSAVSAYVPAAASTAVSVPGDNLLYNGAMQVAQRGTSETGITTSGYYTADRWDVTLTTLGTWTQTIEADGPTGSGFSKSFKMECTTADAAPAAGDRLQVIQRFEGQDLQGLKYGSSAAESLTLSFWVKSDTTGTYVVELYNSDGSGAQVSVAYTISSADTWEKKTITIAGDTSNSFDNDNAQSMLIGFWLGAGSNYTSGTLNTTWGSVVTANRAVGQTNLAAATGNYWQVTGVQLETGTVATEFDHKPYGVELAECQRYYHVHVDATDGSSNRFIGMGIYTVSDRFRTPVSLPTTMRTIPSLEQTTGSGVYSFDGRASNGTFNSFTGITLSNYNVVNLDLDGISGSDDATWVYTSSPVDTGRIAFDAEL